MQTAEEVMSSIANAALKSSPTVRDVEKLEPGLVERQGDIYLLHLGRHTKAASQIKTMLRAIRDGAKPEETTLKALPASRGKKTASRQLATGDTQGSRHVASGKLEVFAPVIGAHALVGPIVVAPGRWTLEHPEHGHASVPAGCYQVLYQRDFKAERAQEIRRVAD